MKTVELLQCGKSTCQHVLLESERVWVQEDEITRRATCPKCGNDAFYTLTAQGKHRMQGDDSPREIDPVCICPSPRMGMRRAKEIMSAKHRALGIGNPFEINPTLQS